MKDEYKGGKRFKPAERLGKMMTIKKINENQRI